MALPENEDVPEVVAVALLPVAVPTPNPAVGVEMEDTVGKRGDKVA